MTRGCMAVRRWLLTGLLALASAVLLACASETPTETLSSAPALVATSPLPAESPAGVSVLPSPPAAPPQPPPAPAASHSSGSLASSPAPATLPAGGLGEVAFGYVRELAEGLGPRASGTRQERAAAEFLVAKFEEFGYSPTLQPFTVRTLSRELSSLTLDGPGSVRVGVIPLDGSATGTVSGNLVPVGLARAQDLPEGGLSGAIALVERGLITFEEKVNRVKEAGARGAVIYNNVPGNFQGALRGAGAIPAVAIDQKEGERLNSLLAGGEVLATLTVIAESRESQNVVAERKGQGAEVVVLGAHYDTVPDVPGANDNGSGTGVLVALARQLSGRSLPFTVRFIAFGSEELGLIGSRHYVDSLSQPEQQQITAMLNFDSLGSGDSLEVLGSASLTSLVAEAAAGLGISLKIAPASPAAGSDHASFARAGVPAIMFASPDFSRIHTAEDTTKHINGKLLADAGRLALALLEMPGLFQAWAK